MKIIKVESFKNDNIEELPGNNGNAYSSSKYLYNSIKVTPNNIIESSYKLDEDVDWEVDDKSRGGVIIFSTDVNAIELSDNKIINRIKQKIKTLSNRLNSTKKIDKISQNNELIGWTIGKFLSGRYTSKNGIPFGENSLSVELIGIDTNKLIKIATELGRDFDQETVLVKDYTTQKIYFVNRD